MDIIENKEVLTFKIDTGAIEAEVLSDSLKAISSLYKGIIGSQEVAIQISEVRKGSFEFDFIADYGVAILPLIENINTVGDFIGKIKACMDFFNKKDTNTTELPTMEQAKNLQQILQPIIINEGNGTVNFITNANGGNILITKDEAKEAVGNIKSFIADNKNEGTEEATKVKIFEGTWITFTQTRNDDKKGIKINASKIYNTELSAIFCDENLQKQIMGDDANPLNYRYCVDLEVNYKEGKTPTCKILALKRKQNLQPSFDELY